MRRIYVGCSHARHPAPNADALVGFYDAAELSSTLRSSRVVLKFDLFTTLPMQMGANSVPPKILALIKSPMRSGPPMRFPQPTNCFGKHESKRLRKSASISRTTSASAPKADYEFRPLRFDVAEAARLLRMSRAQLYNRMKDGLIAAQKDGARTYITRAELKRYVGSCERKSNREV